MIRYTERGTGSVVMTTELNTLTDDTAALATSALSNDAAAERKLLVDVSLVLAAQGSARASDAQISILIVPEANSTYGDTSTLKTAQNYVGRTPEGQAATLTLDAATTARTMTFARIVVPDSNYKVGVLNETGQSLASGSNTLWVTGAYSTDQVTYTDDS